MTLTADFDPSVLIETARVARLNGYAPYSKYIVGAAVLDENGLIHDGCNVETVNLKGGNCGEGGAIAAMVRSGGRRIEAIAIVSPSNGAPCGNCRQLIREFSDKNTKIVCAGITPGSPVKIYTIDQLLPDSFGPEDLTVS